jgi:hypothetical protein
MCAWRVRGALERVPQSLVIAVEHRVGTRQ